MIFGRLKELRDLEEDPISTVTSLSTEGVMELLTHVLQQCFFSWDGSLFKQSAGLPMGGRLSPILSNLFMEELEYGVLCTSAKIPHLYLRFVDDVLLVWNQRNGPHDVFLAELNNCYPQIQLSAEIE